MIRGLLAQRNRYMSNAAKALSNIGPLEEKKREKASNIQEIYGIINSILSLATMKSMKNSQMSKNVEGVNLKGYKITPNNIFDQIFGSPYTFEKNGKDVDYQQFLIDKYINEYGDTNE